MYIQLKHCVITPVKIADNIIIITGSYGYGYKNWNKNFKTEINSELRHKNREYAAEILKKYADYVFITENESGKENLYDICYELKLYLKDKVKSDIIKTTFGVVM